MWLLLHRGLPPNAVFEPGKVVYSDDPHQAAKNLGFKDPVDGFIDGGQPAVYPTGKRIVAETAGSVTALMTTPVADVINFFREGISFPESAKVIDDAKLRVALELWGAYFTEISANARFLTLVMALEALAIGTPRTQLVLDLQDKWKKEIEALEKNIDPDSDDAVSLNALKNDLESRREQSIGRQIRTLVFNTLHTNGDRDAKTMMRKTAQLYKHRGTLVHKGKLKSSVLGKCTTDAKNIVECVLRARFLQKAKPGVTTAI